MLLLARLETKKYNITTSQKKNNKRCAVKVRTVAVKLVLRSHVCKLTITVDHRLISTKVPGKGVLCYDRVHFTLFSIEKQAWSNFIHSQRCSHHSRNVFFSILPAISYLHASDSQSLRCIRFGHNAIIQKMVCL